jgi:hypothetical protein
MRDIFYLQPIRNDDYTVIINAINNEYNTRNDSSVTSRLAKGIRHLKFLCT